MTGVARVAGVAGVTDVLPLPRFVWAMERYRPGLHVVDTLLWAAAGGIPLLNGLVLRHVFDALSGAAPAGLTLPALIAALLALALSRMALYAAGVFADLTYRYHVRTLLRRNVLERLLRRATALPVPTGDVVNRLYEDATESEELVALLPYQAVTALGALVAVVVLLRVSVLMTLVALTPVVVTAALAHLAGGPLRRRRTASREATGRVTSLLGELFGAVQALQAAGREGAAVRRFRALSHERRRAALADVLTTQLLNALEANTVSLATGALLLLAGRSIRVGSFSVGELALFVAYLDWLTEFARTFGSYLRRYRQRGVSVRRLLELMPGAAPDVLVRHAPVHLVGAGAESLRGGVSVGATISAVGSDGAALTGGLGERLVSLEVVGLTRRHPSSGGGIADVSFEVRGGTLTVITGRVGSGKSTLLRVLLGLEETDAGLIRWNGRVVDDPASFFVPPRCAYVPQAPHLFSDTLMHNVLLGIDPPPGALDRALRLSRLEPDLATLPRGLETQVGPRGLRLSGGQVQRAAAARALVRRPALLVLDDLTSALDVETERGLWDALKAESAATGMTILAVSHRPAALERADQVITLNEGRMISR